MKARCIKPCRQGVLVEDVWPGDIIRTPEGLFGRVDMLDSYNTRDCSGRVDICFSAGSGPKPVTRIVTLKWRDGVMLYGRSGNDGRAIGYLGSFESVW